MCYLVAKDINKRGCIALKSKAWPSTYIIKSRTYCSSRLRPDRLPLPLF
ncbi:DUF6718 family protein [Butyrivibrio sp. AE2005]